LSLRGSGGGIPRRAPLPVVSERDRKTVEVCLNRILRSPSFQGSKRCQELLRYLVIRSLEEDAGPLKERMIGAELYSRDPAYDTAADAIVRVKANEVRKRLALYYGQTGQSDPVRIELPVGSYVPVFHWTTPELVEEAPAESPNGSHAGGEPQPPAVPPQPVTRRRVVAISTLGAAAGAGWWLLQRSSSPSELFWTPFYHSDQPVLLCIPARHRWFFNPEIARALAAAAQKGSGKLDLNLRPGDIAVVPSGEMSVQNFHAIFQLASHLGRHRVPVEVRLVSEISAEAIRRRQVILVGAYHNPWAMGLSAGMRYVFESENEGSQESSWVRDRKTVGPPAWVVPKLWPYAAQDRDYAIIARTHVPYAGQIVVSFAGINGFGTQVAAEFLTTPHYLEELARVAPAGWERKNCQIVLETKVVQNVPTPPQIIAVHVW
jgi:hypothetical protein